MSVSVSVSVSECGVTLTLETIHSYQYTCLVPWWNDILLKNNMRKCRQCLTFLVRYLISWKRGPKKLALGPMIGAGLVVVSEAPSTRCLSVNAFKCPFTLYMRDPGSTRE